MEDVELTYDCEKCDNTICHDCAAKQPKYMYTCEEDCDNCKEVSCDHEMVQLARSPCCPHVIVNECPMCTSNLEYAKTDDSEIVKYLLKRYDLDKEKIKREIIEQRSSDNEIAPIDMYEEYVHYTATSYLHKCIICEEIWHIEYIYYCQKCYEAIYNECVKKLPKDAYEYDENCEYCKVFECSNVKILKCQKCLKDEIEKNNANGCVGINTKKYQQSEETERFNRYGNRWFD